MGRRIQPPERLIATALIDADVVAYRAAVVSQEDWGDGLVTADEYAAAERALDMAEQWRKKAKCDELVMCLSDRNGANFRKKICPEYKAHRGEKPKAYSAVIEAIEDELPVVRIGGMEADDVMGILATNGQYEAPVIVSIDKDMHTVPGQLFNPDKGTRPWKISKLSANNYWMTQALTGDSADGYKGAFRVGAVGAARILAGLSSVSAMWDAVLTTFIDKGHSEAEAYLSVRMARILRDEDYDPDSGRIRLWGPNAKKEKWIALPVE